MYNTISGRSGHSPSHTATHCCSCRGRRVSKLHSHLSADVLSSRPGEFRPESLTEPDVRLSTHPALHGSAHPIIRAHLCSPFAILPLYGGCDLMLKNRARPFALLSLQSLITTTSESAPHADIPTFGLVVSATCAFSVGNPRVVPKLCHSRPMHVPATYTPPQERAACRFAFALVPTQGPGIGFLWTLSFRRLIGWMVHFRSAPCIIPDRYIPGLFLHRSLPKS